MSSLLVCGTEPYWPPAPCPLLDFRDTFSLPLDPLLPASSPRPATVPRARAPLGQAPLPQMAAGALLFHGGGEGGDGKSAAYMMGALS